MKSTLKSILIDILLLFKNLLHWNLSKILIYIWGMILGFLSVIPFALFFLIYSYFAGVPFLDFINSLKDSVYMTTLFGNVIYILALGAFSISYFFTFILFIKLNNGYLEGEKIAFLKNSYLDYKLYFKYILLILLNFLILLVPVLIFLLIFGVLVISFGGLENVTMLVLSRSNNIFSIILFILFIILIIKLYYLFYRFIFSYFILVEHNNNGLSVIKILKKSYNMTKGYKKFLKFNLVLFLTIVIYIPFLIISTYINGNYSDLSDYSSYINLEIEDQANLKTTNTYHYESLEIKYSSKDLTEIESLENKYYLLSNIFSIFEFIFIFGLFTMILNSVYRRIILDDGNIKLKENNKEIEKIEV